VLYEMTVGNAPFGDTDRMSKFEIFNNINEKQPSIPLLMSSSLSNLIRGLLQKEPEKRSDWNAVKSSAWVSDVNWTALAELKIQPPWIPPAAQEPSCDHFVKWETKDVDVPSSTTSEVI
jgi:serine/threonine protein kinase